MSKNVKMSRMPTVYRKISIGVIGIFALAIWYVGYLYHSTPAGVVTVVRTDHGFEPARLSIPVGTTVQFTASTSDGSFWPASDAHPSHGIYPDFDPQQAVATTDTWEFTFSDIGSWGYHDHVRPSFTGEIIVHNRYGQTTIDCLALDTQTRGNLQAECWIQEFTDLYATGELDSVFAQFDTYLESGDPVFKRNCHDILHEIGDLAYNDYLKYGTIIDRPETAYCGYGFYHGFIETMFLETGDYTASREYCTALSYSEAYASAALAADAMYACQHGVGHAVFDSIDGNLWGDAVAMTAMALDQCERIFTNHKAQTQCASGVSNALAIAYDNYYDLVYNRDDVFEVCETILPDYQADCYLEVLIYYISSQDLAPTTVFAMITAMPLHAQPIVVEAYASNEIEWFTEYSHENIKQTMQMCTMLTTGALRDSCMSGIHFGIYKKNTPYTNQAESEAVCDLLTTDDERDFCKAFIWNKL